MGALDEQCGRLLLRKRLEPVLLLPRHTKRRSARDEHPYLGAGAKDSAHDGSGGEEVLEVVQEEQKVPSAEEPREVVGSPDRLGDLRGQELGIRETRERYPEDAVIEPADELRSDLEREACLARAARACDGEEARPVREHRDELLELLLAADERDRDDRQVGCVERPEGRELALAELEEALCSDQVLQAVLAEVVGSERLPREGGASSLRRRSGRRAPRLRSAPRGGRPCRRSPPGSRAARRCGCPSGPGSARPRAPSAPRPRRRRRRPPVRTRRRTRLLGCPPRPRRVARRPHGSRADALRGVRRKQARALAGDG